MDHTDDGRYDEADADALASGHMITARLEDGPLKGKAVDVEPLEGRPPKTLDLPADDDEGTCRYCLEGWMQSGDSAIYTFLYRV